MSGADPPGNNWKASAGSGRAETDMRARMGMAETSMWARTSLAATGMWVRMRTGRSGHVGADVMAGTVTVGTDVFPKMTVSQKLVLG
jgi:hypothetical protein